MKIIRIVLLFFLLILGYVIPVHAQGCSNMQPNSRGGLLSWLGLTATAEISAQRDCQVQYVKGQAAARVADIEAQAQIEIQQIRTHLAEIENQRFESAHQRDIAIASAQADAQYKIAGVESKRDQTIASVNGQRDIAITEVRERGATDRTLIEQGSFAKNAFIIGAFIVLAILALGYVLVAYKERTPTPQITIPMPVLIEARRTNTMPMLTGQGQWTLMRPDGTVHRTWHVKKPAQLNQQVKLLEGEVQRYG